MKILGFILLWAAVANINYLYHWREKRMWLHVLPYVLWLGSMVGYAIGMGRIDFGFALLMLLLIAFMHFALWLDQRKQD